MRFLRPRGFTLLELSTVLAIVGVALAMAIPMVGAYRARQLVRGAASELAAQLQMARSLARAAQRGFDGWPEDARVRQAGVRFEESGYELFVDADERSDGLGEAMLGRTRLGGNHALSASHPEVRFRRNGTLAGEAATELVLWDRPSGAGYRIQVSYGGRIKVLPSVSR